MILNEYDSHQLHYLLESLYLILHLLFQIR
nr:MAG TPA: hypothetical protein [Caudoviricetes sp.]